MKNRLFLFGLILMLFSFLAVSAALADPLVMPASLRIIEAESFYGDTSISSVVLGDHVQEIQSKAFANIIVLKKEPGGKEVEPLWD